MGSIGLQKPMYTVHFPKLINYVFITVGPLENELFEIVKTSLTTKDKMGMFGAIS